MGSIKIDTEAEYPYTAGSRGMVGQCQSFSNSGTFNVKTYVPVSANTGAIQEAVQQQPCSAFVAANSGTFQYYTSGVITGTACGTSSNLAVLIVGYGNGYFLVQNSWGTWWGDQGYVKIGFAGSAGVCGINQYVAYPVV